MDNTPIPHTSIPFETISSRYELIDKLGSGGMGTVYRAADRLTGSMIALKRVLLPDMPHNVTATPVIEHDEMRLAITREFRTLASLRHPNLVGVMDYGFDSDRQPYFTMDLLIRPHTLTAAARSVDHEGKVRLLVDMLRALAYVHRRGIVHRDLKPANVLVEDGERVRVLDFGLAIQRTQITSSDLRSTLGGTFSHKAPELFNDQPATPAADLYAVGIMAYEIFAGRFPYNDKNIGVLLNDILYTRPDFGLLPRPMAQVLERLLDKRPAARYQQAEEVIIALCTAAGVPIPEESDESRESFLQASAFVGRQQELDKLRSALSEALEGRGSSWLVGGESGIGKSRLLDELRLQGLIKGALTLRGQAISDSHLLFHIWRTVVRRLVLTTDLSDLEAGILREIVPDIESLLRRPVPPAAELDGERARQRLVATIVDIFRRQTAPLVLLFEDIHWTNASLEALRQLNVLVSGFPWLIIASYRDDEAPHLPDSLPDMQHIHLTRFDSGTIAELSTAMLGEIGSNPGVLSLMKRETEGNALFIVEVARALAREISTSVWDHELTLPERITAGGVDAVLRRRLTAVPIWARPVLNLAAVAGRQIDLTLLEVAVAHGAIPLPANATLEDWLTAAANASVVERVAETWQFTHEKLRETLLADLSTEDRPALNRAVARAIETLHPDREAYAEVLADLWYYAGDHARTLTCTLSAAQRLIDLTANYKRANRLINRAITLPDLTSGTQASLAMLLADAATRQAEYTEAHTHLETALQHAADEPHLRVRALYLLSQLYGQEGESARSEEAARSALELARQIGDRPGQANSLLALGNRVSDRGSYAEARALLEESLEIARELGSPPLIAYRLNALGNNSWSEGRYLDALNLYTEAHSIFQAAGDRWGTASALGNMANMTSSLGRYAESRTHYEQALAIFRSTNSRQRAALVLVNLGVLALVEGYFSVADAYLTESLSLAEQLSARKLIMNTLVNRAYVYALQHKIRAAQADIEAGLALAREMDDRFRIGFALYVSGLIASAAGDLHSARRHFQSAIPILREFGEPTEEHSFTLDALAATYIAQGDLIAARTTLQDGLVCALHSGLIPVMLSLIATTALWLHRNGQDSRAAQLAALVAAHPGTRAETRLLRLDQFPPSPDTRTVVGNHCHHSKIAH